MNHIGAKIRGLRIAQGTTLPDLAHRAAISKGLLSTIETDETSNPSLSTLSKIAEALGTPIGVLMDSVFPVASLPPTTKPDWHKQLTTFMKSKGAEPDSDIFDAMLVLQNRKALKNEDLEYWKFLYKSIESSFKK